MRTYTHAYTYILYVIEPTSFLSHRHHSRVRLTYFHIIFFRPFFSVLSHFPLWLLFALIFSTMWKILIQIDIQDGVPGALNSLRAAERSPARWYSPVAIGQPHFILLNYLLKEKKNEKKTLLQRYISSLMCVYDT